MFSLFIILPLFAAQTDTSNLIYRCDFEDPIQTCFNGKTPDDPHNCLIVPCTNLDEKNHCMVITSKAHGGDCFTDYFEHGVDLDEDEDLLAL